MKRGNILIPTVLTFVIGVPLAWFFWRAPIVPALASAQGGKADFLLRLVFAIASLVFGLVAAFLGYSLVAFRRNPNDTEDGPPIHGHTTLEIVWTVVPLIVILSVGALGTKVMYDVARAQPNELTVKVVGFQWAWTFEYPAYGIVTGELVLPVEQPIAFEVTSTDVVHSFWVPEFRMKIDAIPGRVNVIRHTPVREGEFKVRCAEMCGTGHAAMLAPVRVVSGTEFLQWVNEQTGAVVGLSEAAQRGKDLASQYGCIGCHSVDGAPGVGPTWKGLYGSTRELADGTTVTADDEYLYKAIVDPGSQIVAGFQNIMPATFDEQLTDEQIRDIIEYIKTLK